jgi:hypothetical protein
MSPVLDLLQYLERTYLKHQFDVSGGAACQYRISCRMLMDFAGRKIAVSELTDDLLLEWLASLRRQNRSGRTINSKRQAILMLWRFAHRRGEHPQPPPDICRVPMARVMKRNPTAWNQNELKMLLMACRTAPSCDGWNPNHWTALVLTCYDSGERLGALLKTPAHNLDYNRGLLLVEAEHRKWGEDKVHRLHPSTVAALEKIKASRELFPWPFGVRQIWVRFGKILKAAGLPATRRDKFHRLRRTAYTLVYAKLGPQAASEFAGHQTDLSAFYLDRTFLQAVDPLDALPRPL